ncbi:MAG: DUF2182 domain-containing protein [Methylococcaceae bacterium]|nr:DUF2182 domain-containing protein [Methylococcaceae bacterium]
MYKKMNLKKQVEIMPLNSYRLQQAVILFMLLAISSAGWIYMLSAHHHSMTMAPLHHSMTASAPHTWSLTDFTATFVVWAVMMIAMMTPSIIPMVFRFLQVRRGKTLRYPYAFALAFLVGYFFAWLGFCVLSTAAQCQLQAFALLSPMMESQNVILSAVLLILVGLYQFTRWKAACLNHCRVPNDLTKECHRDPIIVGLHHGFYCVGSCWALMVMMFAVGVLNLPWMVIITLIVVMEKTLPINPLWLRCSSGLGFFIWGGWQLMPFWI